MVGAAKREFLDRIAGQKRVALVIGNSGYQNVSRLPNPTNDATDMAAALTALGFDVHHISDVGKAALESALLDFSDDAVGADIALMFYAGHGIEVNRQNYLIPVDAKLETDRHLRFEAVSLEAVMASLEAVRGVRIVLLDACRNNPFSASMKITSTTRSIGRGLSRVEASKGTLISFAAKEGTVAEDGSDRNSPFTSALLATLNEPVEISLLFRKVRDSVLSETDGRQEPYVSASLPSNPIYLVPPIIEKPKPVAAPAASVDPIARDYDLAAVIDTAAAWQAFLAVHGGKQDNYRVRLARAALQGHQAVGSPPGQTDADAGSVAQKELSTSTVPEPPDGQSVASLGEAANSVDASEPPVDPIELARAVQSELDRLGCEPGEPDGIWGRKSERAVTEFNKYAKLQLGSASPSTGMLETLESFKARVCPLDCSAREDPIGEKCVVKSCPSGKVLSGSGQCESIVAREPPAGRAPATDDAPATRSNNTTAARPAPAPPRVSGVKTLAYERCLRRGLRKHIKHFVLKRRCAFHLQ